MTRAYNELYLSDAKNRLADMFDYAINDCKEEPDWFAVLFVQSGYAQQFERGNPTIVSGRSGIELAIDVLYYAYREQRPKERRYSQERTPEYWAGWALAEFQWHSGRRFKDIFDSMPFSRIVSMYKVYHEMDISRFIEYAERICSEIKRDTKLKTIRESRGLSQAELAQQSGVKLRSIQMYEQRVNNIDKAQGQTLYKLARTLGCSVEDLLEHPMKGAES